MHKKLVSWICKKVQPLFQENFYLILSHNSDQVKSWVKSRQNNKKCALQFNWITVTSDRTQQGVLFLFFTWTILTSTFHFGASLCGGLPSSMSGSAPAIIYTLCCRPWQVISYSFLYEGLWLLVTITGINTPNILELIRIGPRRGLKPRQ